MHRTSLPIGRARTANRGCYGAIRTNEPPISTAHPAVAHVHPIHAVCAGAKRRWPCPVAPSVLPIGELEQAMKRPCEARAQPHPTITLSAFVTVRQQGPLQPTATEAIMKLIKTDLRGLNALQMLSRARVVRNQMKNNPLFPSPTPSMPDFEAAIDELNASVRETYDGASKYAFQRKKGNLEKLAAMIRSLAAYVSIVAQGDASIVLAAGFEQRKPSRAIHALPKPRNPKAKTGTMPRTITIRWEPVRGVRMYKVHVRKGYGVIDGPSQIILTSKSSCLITDLDPLEYYTMSVQAVGAHAESPVSDTATALSIGFKAA